MPLQERISEHLDSARLVLSVLEDVIFQLSTCINHADVPWKMRAVLERVGEESDKIAELLESTERDSDGYRLIQDVKSTLDHQAKKYGSFFRLHFARHIAPLSKDRQGSFQADSIESIWEPDDYSDLSDDETFENSNVCYDSQNDTYDTSEEEDGDLEEDEEDKPVSNKKAAADPKTTRQASRTLEERITFRNGLTNAFRSYVPSSGALGPRSRLYSPENATLATLLRVQHVQAPQDYRDTTYSVALSSQGRRNRNVPNPPPKKPSQRQPYQSIRGNNYKRILAAQKNAKGKFLKQAYSTIGPSTTHKAQKTPVHQLALTARPKSSPVCTQQTVAEPLHGETGDAFVIKTQQGPWRPSLNDSFQAKRMGIIYEPSPQIAEPTAEGGPFPICTHCGASGRSAREKFCWKCGWKLRFVVGKRLPRSVFVPYHILAHQQELEQYQQQQQQEIESRLQQFADRQQKHRNLIQQHEKKLEQEKQNLLELQRQQKLLLEHEKEKLEQERREQKQKLEQERLELLIKPMTIKKYVVPAPREQEKSEQQPTTQRAIENFVIHRRAPTEQI
mmetsp:Transcript_5635/g.10750  ORF Transcript_5635/g.10750 Transcript_5635/m.10750 type:complete len:562 (-) Transcript_5635:112-1797(-)|eukprot:CAMPEP_0175169362 /NCGR_PEP_ID=MMETSP0087-20121206/29534_1 /TAXON_ID=136419 /ORGANISM="Unknown Unknown, Strain D1" /LENGTH=561 /DNA_ID=CAMNT_0016459711 /DNA_START=32 /DNA_END=1717 /DNA_ORIENTATION=-